MNSIAPSRSYVIVEKPRQLCRLCGLIWNRGSDVCPPHIRSIKEDAMLEAESLAKVRYAS